METRKLNKYFGLYFLVISFCHSCKNTTSNQNSKETNLLSSVDSNTVIRKENSVEIVENVLINNIKYQKHTVTDYSLNNDIIYLIKGNDTIRFEEDGLYVTDSIYDINDDNKMDFNVIYQSTNGLVTFSYLFNQERNLVSSKPVTLYNYRQIGDHSFFQVFNEFAHYRFEKYHWSGLKPIPIMTYLVDFSNEPISYYKMANNDTIKLHVTDVGKKEKRVMDNFITRKQSSM